MRTTSRTAFMAPVLLLALMLAAAPAAAISEVSDIGNTGNWLANDSDVAPGGRCDYNDNFRLSRISARPPIVYSYRARGQTVAWRLQIVRSHKVSEPNNYADEVVYRSPWQRRSATLSRAASFSRLSWTREGSLADSSIRFKVWVIIKWFRPSDGRAEGTVKFRYDWFRQSLSDGSSTIDQTYFCYRAPY